MQKNDSYNDLMRFLQNAKPEIANAESITENIMQQIKKRPVKKHYPVWCKIGKAATIGIAAALTGLFIFQSIYAEAGTNTSSQKTTAFHNKNNFIDSHCEKIIACLIYNIQEKKQETSLFNSIASKYLSK